MYVYIFFQFQVINGRNKFFDNMKTILFYANMADTIIETSIKDASIIEVSIIVDQISEASIMDDRIIHVSIMDDCIIEISVMDDLIIEEALISDTKLKTEVNPLSFI